MDENLISFCFSLNTRMSATFSPSSDGLLIDSYLEQLVYKVKKQRKWFRVSQTCKAFLKAFQIVRPESVKSKTLMIALVKAVQELRELLSNQLHLIRKGVEEAWKISGQASSWGHMTAHLWKNDRNFVIYCGIVKSWFCKLFPINRP